MESLLEILTKRGSQTIHKPADAHPVTNAIRECISSISIWNIANQLGKYDFSCRLVVNNLKEMHFFLIKLIEIADLILAMCLKGIVLP